MTAWGVYRHRVCACVLCLTSEGVQNGSDTAEKESRKTSVVWRESGGGGLLY